MAGVQDETLKELGDYIAASPACVEWEIANGELTLLIDGEGSAAWKRR